MSKLIVTTSLGYVDIDSLACSIAYAELQNHLGRETIVYLPGKFNQTCTPDIMRECSGKYLTVLSTEDYHNAEFVIVDINLRAYLDPQINLESIVAIFDHHLSADEDYWQTKLGINAKIEDVGACATLIWREIKAKKFEAQISQLTSKLLYTAIISNTLNFLANNTQEIDRLSAEELALFANLPSGYVQKYFENVDQTIKMNLQKIIAEDAKDFMIGGKSFRLIQIELWNADKFIADNIAILIKFLNETKAEFTFCSLPAIQDRVNYLICYSDKTKTLLQEILNIEFAGYLAQTSRLIMRKEFKTKITKFFSK